MALNEDFARDWHSRSIVLLFRSMQLRERFVQLDAKEMRNSFLSHACRPASRGLSEAMPPPGEVLPPEDLFLPHR